LDVLPPEQDHEQLRGQVRLCTPPGAKILVVSKGDSALLDLGGRSAGHFPQTEAGLYAGCHPADSAEAIARLDDLRSRGAEYLLFPATSFWWLDHYSEFARHLETVGSLVQRDRACSIYSLRRLTLPKPGTPAGVIALLATFNEERFIANCLRDLVAQGVAVYLVDNDSTDRTVEIARGWLGRGVVGIERLPRDGTFRLRQVLARKEELATELDAEWFIHADADEIHRAPYPGWTLAEALAAVAEAGYNAVNFQEFTFIPTAESPDHDHAGYQDSMRWYYPFLPRCPWAVRAWRKQAGPVDLASSGGHQLQFSGQALYPSAFSTKHYQFLSVAHACRKYGLRRHDPAALQMGLHGGARGWRHQFRGETAFPLLPASELREFRGDDRLDASRPRVVHFLEQAVAALRQQDRDDHSA